MVINLVSNSKLLYTLSLYILIPIIRPSACKTKAHINCITAVTATKLNKGILDKSPVPWNIWIFWRALIIMCAVNEGTTLWLFQEKLDILLSKFGNQTYQIVASVYIDFKTAQKLISNQANLSLRRNREPVYHKYHMTFFTFLQYENFNLHKQKVRNGEYWFNLPLFPHQSVCLEGILIFFLP